MIARTNCFIDYYQMYDSELYVCVLLQHPYIFKPEVATLALRIDMVSPIPSQKEHVAHFL